MFRSVKWASLIMVNVALARVGGLLALLITGTYFSVSSGVGFLALFGVSVQTGGGNVLMQLVKAWEKGWFPFTARLVVKDTKTPGRKTLWLEKVEG